MAPAAAAFAGPPYVLLVLHSVAPHCSRLAVVASYPMAPSAAPTRVVRVVSRRTSICDRRIRFSRSSSSLRPGKMGASWTRVAGQMGAGDGWPCRARYNCIGVASVLWCHHCSTWDRQRGFMACRLCSWCCCMLLVHVGSLSLHKHLAP